MTVLFGVFSLVVGFILGILATVYFVNRSLMTDL